MNWMGYFDPGTGRYLTPDPIGLVGGLNPYRYALNNPINSFDANGLWAGDVHSGVGRSDYGTFIWATQLGLSADVSKIIAPADNETDAYGNWAPVAGDPGRHFDTAHGGVDSRVLYANTELEKAIAQYKKGNHCEAYKSLGKGLHSTQDIIAHMGWVPLLAHPSWYDDASFRTSELEATEIATKLYLWRFYMAVGR